MNFLSVANAVVSKPRPKKRRAVKERPAASAPASAAAQHPWPDSVCRPEFSAEAALDRTNGDRELLGKMVGVFAKQWSQLSTEMVQASRRRDGATLQLTAQKLQRSLASFDARDAGRAAQELETSGRTGAFHDVDKSCARLKTEIERLVNALKEFTQ